MYYKAGPLRVVVVFQWFIGVLIIIHLNYFKKSKLLFSLQYWLFLLIVIKESNCCDCIMFYPEYWVSRSDEIYGIISFAEIKFCI